MFRLTALQLTDIAASCTWKHIPVLLGAADSWIRNSLWKTLRFVQRNQFITDDVQLQQLGSFTGNCVQARCLPRQTPSYHDPTIVSGTASLPKTHCTTRAVQFRCPWKWRNTDGLCSVTCYGCKKTLLHRDLPLVAGQYRRQKGCNCINMLVVLRNELNEVGLNIIISRNKLVELSSLAEDTTQLSKAKKDSLQL